MPRSTPADLEPALARCEHERECIARCRTLTQHAAGHVALDHRGTGADVPAHIVKPCFDLVVRAAQLHLSRVRRRWAAGRGTLPPTPHLRQPVGDVRHGYSRCCHPARSRRAERDCGEEIGGPRHFRVSNKTVHCIFPPRARPTPHTHARVPRSCALPAASRSSGLSRAAAALAILAARPPTAGVAAPCSLRRRGGAGPPYLWPRAP